jgi:hypothetical protein
MQRSQKIVSGVCSAAIALAPAAATVAAAALARDLTAEPWEVVPEESLRDLRGGLDLGSLVANFAIQRVVEIDGVVVARMQIVISNLDRLNSGGMPTITVTGPLAEIVQFMQTPGNVSLAGAASTVVTNAAASTAPSSASAPAASLPMRQAANSPAPSTPTSGAAVAPSPSAVTGPSITSSGGNTGAVSSTGTQSGSMAQMGTALATAVATASGALAQSGSSTAPSASVAASSPSVAAATPYVTAATTSASPTANAPASPSPVSPPGNPAGTAATARTTAGTTQTIPVGTTGQVVVLNNLPNAAAITTAVQNSVHAATIQTQTTISATLNSIAFLNAFTLANSIRQQVAAGP